MDSDERKVQQLEALEALEAQIRDQRRLGGPTGALQHSRDKLLASISEAAVEAKRRAHGDPLREERWHSEHYHRRGT